MVEKKISRFGTGRKESVMHPWPWSSFVSLFRFKSAVLRGVRPPDNATGGLESGPPIQFPFMEGGLGTG